MPAEAPAHFPRGLACKEDILNFMRNYDRRVLDENHGIIEKESIELGVKVSGKEEAIDKLIGLMAAGGRLNDKAPP